MPSDTLTIPPELAKPMLRMEDEKTEPSDQMQHSLHWPTSPTPIRFSIDLWTILESLIDFILAMLAIPFSILGILSRSADGKLADSVSYAEGVLFASRFVSSPSNTHRPDIKLRQTTQYRKA